MGWSLVAAPGLPLVVAGGDALLGLGSSAVHQEVVVEAEEEAKSDFCCPGRRHRPAHAQTSLVMMSITTTLNRGRREMPEWHRQSLLIWSPGHAGIRWSS